VADHPLRFMIGQPQALGSLKSGRRPGAALRAWQILASSSLWASSC
jgi:hypothetical protein